MASCASKSAAQLAKGPSARRILAPRAAPPRSSTATLQINAYNVTFNMPHSEQQTIEVDAGTSIMDAALEAGVKLPWACRAGACGACVGDSRYLFNFACHLPRWDT